MSEFEETLKRLNGCIGTIKCGCSMTPDDLLFADFLYYQCKEYVKAYDDASLTESNNKDVL